MNCWHWVWFRSAAFRVARIWRSLTTLLGSALGFWLFFVATLCVTLWWRASFACRYHCGHHTENLIHLLKLKYTLQIFAICLFVWLWIAIYRQRKLIVAATVLNRAGKELDGFVAGIGEYVIIRLSGLRELYGTTPTAHETGTLAPPVVCFGGADQLSLAGTVAKSSHIKVPGFEFPLRALVAAGERLIPRRRLAIAVQRQGNELSLLAAILGEGKNWHVTRDLSPRVFPSSDWRYAPGYARRIIISHLHLDRRHRFERMAGGEKM